jgi:hypothetical protein
LTTAFKDELCKIVEIPSEISSKQGTEFLDEAAMLLHEESTYFMEFFFSKQKLNDTVDKLTLTDEENARFMHASNKVDKLVSFFENNVQNLQFSEQSAYFVSLNLMNLAGNPYKDVGKRVIRWVDRIFEEHTSSAIIKYLKATGQIIQNNRIVDYAESLIFEAMKSDPELVMHVLEESIIMFEKLLDHPTILKRFSDSSPDI